MKLRILQSIVLAGVVMLWGACSYTNRELAPLPVSQQDTQVPVQAMSPLPPIATRLEAVTAYQINLHHVIQRTSLDDAIPSEVSDFTYFWTQTNDPYDYNAHRIMTLLDPQSGQPLTMDETYFVGDLAFVYCPSCPIPAEQEGWSVSKRNVGVLPDFTLDLENVSRISGIPLADLVKRSQVVGRESIRGIATTHYRLTDTAILSYTLGMQLGWSSSTPSEVMAATLDTWLTVGDERPFQYMLSAEGRSEYLAGSQTLLPFKLQVDYRVVSVNTPMSITVPDKVLKAVEPSLKALASQ